MAKQYLNPYSRRVQVRVVRSNPIGFSTAEIRALSSHPGFRSDTEEKNIADASERRMLRAQKHAREVYQQGSYYNKMTNRSPFPYQDVGAAFFIERAGRATRPKDEWEQNTQADLNTETMRIHVHPGNPVRIGIFDPMGLGKTVQGALTIFSADALNKLHSSVFPSPYPALVVCPNVLKQPWINELGLMGKFDAAKGEIAKTTSNLTSDSWKDFLKGGGKILITNKEALVDSNIQPSMIVVDEGEWLRNPASRQARTFRNIASNASYTVLLTGTPALNSIADMFPIMGFLKNEPALRSDNDINTAVRSWARDRKLDPNNDLFENAQRMDTVNPDDAARLEESIREISVRRSRQRVFDSNTLDTSLLQQKKHRRAVGIKPDTHMAIKPLRVLVERNNERVSTDLRAMARDAWNRFAAAAANTASGIGTQVAGAGQQVQVNQVLARVVDRIRGAWNELGLLQAINLQPLVGSIANAQQAVEDVLGSQGNTPAHLTYLAALDATRKTYIGIPRIPNDLPGLMAEVATTHAPWHQSQHPGKDLVYYTPRVEVTSTPVPVNLPSAPAPDQPGAPAQQQQQQQQQQQVARIVEELAMALSLHAPEREVYVISGDSNTNRKWVGGVPQGKMKSHQIESLFNKKDPKRPARTVIITNTAKMGLNLRSADIVCMLGRSSSPAIEDQIEDRINRADRMQRGDSPVPEPVAEYLIPQNAFSYILSHRIENRRRNLMRMFGEDVGETNRSDVPPRWGTDRSHPVYLRNLIEEYRREVNSEPDENVRTVFSNLLQAAEFISDPVGFARRQVNQAWSNSSNGLIRASIDNEYAPRPFIQNYYDKTYMLPAEFLLARAREVTLDDRMGMLLRALTHCVGPSGHVLLLWNGRVIMPDGTMLGSIKYEDKYDATTVQTNMLRSRLDIQPFLLGQRDLDFLTRTQYLTLVRCAANEMARAHPAVPRVSNKVLDHYGEYPISTYSCVFTRPPPPAVEQVQTVENVVLYDEQSENAENGFIEFDLRPLGVGKAFAKDHRPGELLFIARSHGRSGGKDFSVIADVDILEPIKGGRRVVLKDYYRVAYDDYYSDKDGVYARAKSSGSSLKKRFESLMASSNPRRLRRKRR